MAKKIIFGIIGALLAFFIFILAVMLGTNALGFQAVAIIELSINIIAGFILSKKFAHNEVVRSLSLGAAYSSIAYLIIIFAAKTIVFSLISGITH